MTDASRTCPAAIAGRLLLPLLLLGASPAAFPAAGSSAAASTWNAFREGERLAGAGDLPGALAAYAEACTSLEAGAPVDRTLTDALALNLYNIAAAFTSAGKSEAALAAFEQIFRLRRSLGKVRDPAFAATVESGARTIAEYMVSGGRASAALGVLRAMADLDPRDAGARLRLASALFEAGDLDGASAAAETARKNDPGAAASWDLTARISTVMADRLAEKGDLREARVRLEWSLQDLADGIKIERSAPRLIGFARTGGRVARLLREEGDDETAQGRASAALAALEEASLLAPSEAAAATERGRILAWDSRWEEAAAAFGEAQGKIENASGAATADAVEARVGRARCLYQRAADAMGEGRFEDAVPLAAEAGRLDPGLAPAAALLGRRIEDLGGRYRRDLEGRRRIVEANPGRGDALIDLGDLLLRYGRYDEARAAYGKALRATEAKPPEDMVRARLDASRAAAGQPTVKVELRAEDGSRLVLAYASDEGLREAREALALAWRMVGAALGPLPPGEIPVVAVFPTQRSFRTGAGPRVGAAATSIPSRRGAAVYAAPGRKPEEWRRIFARALGGWAALRLSRGAAPTWVVEGVAGWAAGDASDPVRGGSAEVVATESWIPASSLDPAYDGSWNDPGLRSFLEVETSLIVEALAKAKGAGAPRSLLVALGSGTAAPAPISTAGLVERAVEAAGVPGLSSLEAAAKAALNASR